MSKLSLEFHSKYKGRLRHLPIPVYREAHRRYPAAVGEDGLYNVAFFGHGRPANLGHNRTPESIWRGLLRKCLREYIEARQKDGAAC